MESWDSNNVKENLYKLQKLNLHAATTKKRIVLLRSKIASLDGHKKDRRLFGTPSAPGPPQASSVEYSLESKEELLHELQEIKRKYLILRNHIEKVLNSLEYKLRQKDWELIPGYIPG